MDFVKLRQEVERLNNLLKDDEQGCFSWCQAVIDSWKKISDAFYGPNKKEGFLK
jgi:hypothetical protein